MKDERSAKPRRRILSLFLVVISLSLVTFSPAVASHKLNAPGTSCYDCHAVGGAGNTVVAGTHLIKKDARIIEIQNGGWTGGDLPCVYCHDNTPKSVRENMAGVKNHYTDFSISKHPVNPYTSSSMPDGDGDAGTLDCINCHNNIPYVGGGANALNPDIHGQDMTDVGYAASTGNLSADNTFLNMSTASSVSPWNSDGNTFCTRQCHDNAGGGTGYVTNVAFHGYTSAKVTLDDVDAGGVPVAPTGCLDGTGTDGCHASHSSDNNIGLLSIRKPGGADVTRNDCGVCHSFDDGGGTSDWSSHGHGKFSSTNNIKCTSCHDASGPHFEATGNTPVSNPSLLAFTVSYSQISDLTDLPTYANCVTSNCHAGYTAHTGDNSMQIGCLDCHEVHGDGIGTNVAMIRQNIPVLSGANVNVVYGTTGDYYASTSPGNYSNYLCDNESCHGQPEGPKDYATAMSTHPGGNVTTGCADCHKHQPDAGGGGGSWASSGCDTCHGANGNYWPQTVSTDIAVRPDRAGAHPKHLAVLAGNSSCGACHPNGRHTGDQDNDPADVHQDGTSTTTYLKDFQNQDDANATYDSTASTCALADCHGETATPDWYTATPITCGGCHGTGALGVPASGLHSLHVNTANNAYVDDCNSCHGTGANTGTHLDHWNGSAGFASDMSSYDTTNVTCDNACHTVSGGNDWQAGAALNCTDCHMDDAVKDLLGDNLGAYLPSTGLHASTNALAHDASFDTGKGCTHCHDESAGVTAGHITGVFQNSIQVSYSFSTANVTSYSQANGCAATCHIDNGKWSRKWLGVVDAQALSTNNPGDAVCDNCHGDGLSNATTVNDVWQGGLTISHQNNFDADGTAGEVLNPVSAHSTCQACHGWGDAAYNETYGGTSPAHGDGLVTMNGPVGVGAEYDSTQRGCLAACHQGALDNAVDPNYAHTMTDSGWVLNFGDFGSGDCDTCHATYGRTHANGDEDSTTHSTVHAISSPYIGSCTACHPHDGMTVPPNTGIHNDSTVNFGGSLPASMNAVNIDTVVPDCSVTNGCHDSDAATEWGTGTLGADRCVDCHATAGSMNQSGFAPTTGSHIQHGADADTTDVTECVACHGGSYATMADPHGNGSIEVLGSGVTWSSPNCTVTPCHSDASNPAQWGSNASVTCNECHYWDADGASVTGAGNTTHFASLSAEHGTHFDADKFCSDCHAYNAGDTTAPRTHITSGSGTDAVVLAGRGEALSNEASVTASQWDSVTNSCSTDVCHDPSAAGYAATWGASTSSCDLCHDSSDPATDGHTAHLTGSLAGTFGFTMGCTDCHVDNGTNYAHQTGAVSFTAGAGYTGAPDGSCANACHNDGRAAQGAPAVAASWNQLYGNCLICHGNPNSTGSEGARHTTHVGSASYVSGCAECHPASSAATHIDGTRDTGGTSSVVYSTTPGTCTNTCHLVDTARGDWKDTAALACTDCHSGTYIGTAPASGLHAASALTVHDQTVPGGSGTGCEKCHNNNTSVSAGHKDGTLDTVSNANFNWNTTNIPSGYDESGDDCAAVCHSDSATWNRQWAGVADTVWNYTDDPSTAAVCGNCHGTFFEGWGIIGETNHVNPSTSNDPATLASATPRSSHDECTLCHGWADGSNNYATGLMHENGFATMNSDVQYQDADGSCSVNCHTPLTLPMNTASGWTVDYVAGGAPACGSCHGDGVTPAVASTTHAAHGATPGDLVSGGPWPDCVQCHPTADYDSGHSGALSYDNTKVTYTGGENGTCTTASCHNQGADQSAAWDLSTSLQCNDCHYYQATVVDSTANKAHAASLSSSHNKHFDKPYQCTQCHNDNSGDSSDPLSHVTGTALNDRAVAVTNEALVVVTDWNDTNDSCTNNTCHDPSNEAFAATWMVSDSTSNCGLCHADTSAWPGTGSHPSHKVAANTYGITIACTNCHTNNGADTAHLDGTVGFVITAPGYGGTTGTPFAASFGTCDTSDCHNDGTGTARATSTWGTAIADPNCGICHDSAPSTLSHNAHFGAAATWGVSPDCDSCHASGGQDQSMGAWSSHIDSAVTMASGAASYDGGVVVGDASYGSCLTNVCHNDGTAAVGIPARAYTWGVSLADDCASCHEGALMAANRHGVHLTSNALPAADDLTECAACHTATATAGKTAAAGSHFDGLRNVSFASTYSYEAGAAGRAGTGSSTTCSAIVCHNGVTTPAWNAVISCGQCHRD
ncbi:MAG: hypothetical protein P1S59_13660, partial [bacterium]|nr:hypothetical protein [bacterium]